ncbi:MAG: ROK family protein [Acidobacteriota bacterium]
MRCVLGIDLGGTKVSAAVLDPEGRVAGRARAKTKAWRDDEDVFGTIARTGHQAIESAGMALADLAAVGIGSPGPLDPATGYIIESANLKFKNFPLGPRLAEEFGVVTTVENDVNAGLYGEFKAGAARGARDVLGVFVGTGIGGGLILNGQLYRGASLNAGEVGHIIIKAGGPRCGCGNRGCLEALASRVAITRDVKQAIKRGRKTVLSKRLKQETDLLSSQTLKAAYDAGDAVCVKAMNRAAKALGVALGSLVNLLGPEMIVLGGGVIEAMGAEFIERIGRATRKVSFEICGRDLKIIKAELGDDAGVIGAAMLARESLNP